MSVPNSKALGRDGHRFDSFEVRVRSGVLLQAGHRLKIQGLPFQMLLILLEHPGETVSKEELGRRLWGQETFVEVDKSLYVVAAKLREALGDNAAGPRYIKTVSGQGYRFIGDVSPVFESTADTPDEPAIPEFQAEAGEPNRRYRAGHIALWCLLAVMASAGVAGYAIYRHRRPLVSDHDRVIVGGLVNSTGNADLDGILSSAVRLKLQESPYLDMVSNENFRSLIKSPDSATVKDQLRACVSLGAQVLLTGQLLALAQGYQIQLTAWHCANGRSLTTEKASADSQMTILSALDLVTQQMRRRLGESDSSLQKFNVPSAQATTASLAALKAFTLGEEKRSQGLNAESITCYKLAVDLDPQFALAYARLGIAYTNTKQPSLSRQYYRKAFELRNRTSDRDRLYIVTHYYAYTTGEINRAIDDYELWRTLYPRDLVPANNLAVEYLEIGQPEKAVGLASRAIQIDPNNEFPYAMLAQAYMKTGSYARVNVLCNDPARAKTDFVGFHDICFQAASAENDEAGMQRQLQWAHGTPQESILINDAARSAIYRGKMSEAQRLFSAAKQNALQHNFGESATDIVLDKANIEADLGFTREAREDTSEALLELGPESAAAEQAFAALALARIGDTTRAETEARNAASQAPLNTILNSAVLASAHAAIRLHQDDPKGAIQSLEEARSFDFCDNMDLSPPYYRGLAYLQDLQPQLAINEFRQVIDHRVLAPTSSYVTLSLLQMGRAYQLLGDRTQAIEAYGAAQEVWKDADPDFPPLQQMHFYQRQFIEHPAHIPRN